MDLLGRARKMIQGLGAEEPPAPQHYRVTCPQGHVLRGQRTEGYQAIRCPGCGEGIFVLPRSPLPEPPAPAVERPRRRAARPEPVADEEIRWTDAPAEVTLVDADRPADDQIEIQWEDEVAPEARPEPAPLAAREVPAARREAPARSPRPTPGAARTDGPRPRPSTAAGGPPQVALAPRPGLGQRVRRHRHKLAVLGVLLFVAATVAFQVRQRYWERLPEIAEVNRAEGLEALRNGVFDVAKRKLATAADALEALGDPEAAQARQSAGEAAILADLASLSLEEIVEEVATRPAEDAQSWFESRHRGRSILLDAHVVAAPGGRRTLDYRVYSEGGKQGWLDLTELRLLADRPDGAPVTFGARFDAITLDETGEWRVRFEPDSGVYLSTPEGWEGLKTIGWPDRELPGEQVGLSPTAALGVLTGVLLVAQEEAPTVRVQDLTTRADLVGRSVVVDGRIDRFEFQQGGGWNRLRLQGSPVVFRLPPQLSYDVPPPDDVARLQGVLKREGGRFAVDVSSIRLYESDLARLLAGISALAATDAENRDAWARWAERRAEEYDDDALRQRARTIAGEAFRLRADRPDAVDSPDRQLELARQARDRQVPDPVPASLVHRALRLNLPRVTAADEAERLAEAAEELLPPEARSPQEADLRGWLPSYDNDPAATYRRADPAARAALDRRLLVDALHKAFALRAAEEPDRALALATQAEAELPDAPEVARDLRREALAETDVASLRLAEVQERAKVYESLGQPDEARALLRRWLDDQRRNRLSPSDAEGRVLLARQYGAMLDDARTAVELLREAWAIDPGSETVADAFRQQGYRQVDGEWVAPGRAAAAPAGKGDAEEAPAPPAARFARDPYVGLTRPEVVDLMGGRPARVVLSATQGQVREQWIYELGGGRTLQYINFVHQPGRRRAVAVSSFQRAP